MGPKRGLEEVPAYRENPQKHDSSKSDSEKYLFRKFYVGRGGSKEPPGGINYFWTVLSPNGALRARPVKLECLCFIQRVYYFRLLQANVFFGSAQK
jgi:hypothetical protein